MQIYVKFWNKPKLYLPLHSTFYNCTDNDIINTIKNYQLCSCLQQCTNSIPNTPAVFLICIRSVSLNLDRFSKEYLFLTTK